MGPAQRRRTRRLWKRSRSTKSAAISKSSSNRNGTIIGVAGRIDWEAVQGFGWRIIRRLEIVDANSERWQARCENRTSCITNRIKLKSASPTTACRIGIPIIFGPSAAVGVLSGGMSARLFTEVREKRGLVLHRLCQSPHAARSGVRAVLCRHQCRAGTGNARCDVGGVDADWRREFCREELARLKARVKSGLIMQGESSSARSGGDCPRLVSSGPSPNAGRIGATGRRSDGGQHQRVSGRESARRFYDRHAGAEPLPWRCEPAASIDGRGVLRRAGNDEFHGQSTWNSKLRRLRTAWKLSPSAIRQAYSTALGFFVNTGARDETDEVSGVSHFLEHMVFKGTPSRSADDVNREFDEMGAHYNAFTSEENTVYLRRRAAGVSSAVRGIAGRY